MCRREENFSIQNKFFVNYINDFSTGGFSIQKNLYFFVSYNNLLWAIVFNRLLCDERYNFKLPLSPDEQVLDYEFKRIKNRRNKDIFKNFIR